MAVTLENLSDTIQAPRTDPVYNCHSYLTKVPIDAIVPFIRSFTGPGDVVVDFFAGSGMTGLAALTLGRHARLSDISVLGQHIAKGYLAEAPDSDVLQVGAEVSQAARHAVGGLYHTVRAADGAIVDFIRTVWSFTYKCPSCEYELVYFNHIIDRDGPIVECPSCSLSFARRSWPRSRDVPVQVVVWGNERKQVEQGVSLLDLQKIKDAERDVRLDQVPSKPIEPHREMYNRSGLGKSGLTETKKFFSPRNAIALLELWRRINEVENEAVKQKLSFCFTAILPRASMRYQWGAKRPLNAQNQTYYIAPVYYEWNVFDLFQRKINAVKKASAHLSERLTGLEAAVAPHITYDIASADALSHLSDESVDYVFTDPPFGSNIFYSDMNLFHEAWLGALTDYTSEAVVHTTGRNKVNSGERYEHLLRSAFREGFRVLKPGSHMSVVFGNSSGQVWGFVQRALREIGFDPNPVHLAVLEKGQRSVKGLNSGTEGVVTVDLILTMRKPMPGTSMTFLPMLSTGNSETLIAKVIEELSLENTRNPSQVYARIIREAIQNGFSLDELHFSDVLVALRNAGYSVDKKTGVFEKA